MDVLSFDEMEKNKHNKIDVMKKKMHFTVTVRGD